MSHIHIPAEILLQILAYVRDNGGPNFHLDLLSCSMVSRFWFDCAWPLASERFNQDKLLDLDAYSAAQIGCVVDAIPTLRQVWKTTPFTSVLTTINKLLFEQTAHGSRADATVQLVHALQPPSKSLEIYIPGNFSAKNATNIQNFVSKLYSGTTSLRIYGGRYHPKYLEPLEPLEQLSILIHDLRHQLQDITVTGTYPPSFIRALSNCSNIRSISIGTPNDVRRTTFNLSDLTAAMFSWPELQSLKIFGKSKDIDLMVEQLAMNPPNHLESLHFDHCETPQLRNLIISLAPRLVRLVLPLPSESTESSDEFLALITSLDMPCLRHLDLRQLANSLTAGNAVQRHWEERQSNPMSQRHWEEGQSNPMSLLRWPKLQRISLRFYFKISPRFLQLVMASCPALEGVRLDSSTFVHLPSFKLIVLMSGSPEVEAILADAGWTRSERFINEFCGNSQSTVATFSRPGGNVWESEEWMEKVQPHALKKKFRFMERYREFSEDDIDGVVIVRCIGIGCENKFV